MKASLHYIFAYCFVIAMLCYAGKSSAQETSQKESYADSLREAKDYNKALHVYRQLLEQQPKNTELLSSAGICYFHLENYNKAKEMFSLAALYTSPDQKCTIAYHYSNLAAVYANVKDYEKELSYSLKAMQLCDSRLMAWNAISAYHDAGKNEEALTLLAKSQYAGDIDFAYLKGRIHYMLAENEESITQLKRYLDYYKDAVPKYGDIALAKEYLLYAAFEQYNNNAPQHADAARNELAAIFTELNRKDDKAIEYLEGRCQENEMPEDPALAASLINDASVNRQRLLMIFGQYQEAEKLIDQALKEKNINAKDKHELQIQLFTAKYRRLLKEWQKSAGAPDEQLLQQVASAFAGALSNKKDLPDTEWDNDEDVEKIIQEIFYSAQRFAKPEKPALHHVLEVIFSACPNAGLREKLIEAINDNPK